MKTIRRAALALLAGLFAVTIIGAPAHAADAPTAPVAVAFTLDPLAVVQLVIAFILPVLVGLVTTRVTSGALKAWMLAGLSLVTALLVELARALTAGETYDLGVALLTALPAFVVSVASHYGLWRPTGVTEKAQETLVTPRE